MSDLLREAIADAKAVRETALANAKMALEEAFTPQLQSMLSAKLREDDEDFEEEPVEDEEIPEEEPEIEEDEDFEDEEIPEDEPEVEEDLEDGDDFEDEPEIEEDGEFEIEDEEEDELDLEAIIRELEDEINEDGEIEDEDEEEFEVDESLFSEDDEDDIEIEDDEEEEVEEDIELEDEEEIEEIKAELEEYKEAVVFLKDKLHEVNILNAKLLFTNKLFKEFALDNNQKLKVVETFDRAQTTREIKLVYSTLAESFGEGNIKRKTKIRESASSKTGSTKPSRNSKKVITEEKQVADRFKKLAGLL